MFISRYTLDSLECDVHMLKRQTRDIAELLGLARGKGSAEEPKDVNELRVASGLLRRAAELLEEAAIRQEKNR